MGGATPSFRVTHAFKDAQPHAVLEPPAGVSGRTFISILRTRNNLMDTGGDNPVPRGLR